MLPPEQVVDLSTAADAVHAVNPWVALAYLVAGVCFILALRGLSSPSTSQRGNRFGMMGMTIAVAATLYTQTFGLPGVVDYALWLFSRDFLVGMAEILGAIAIGAIIGLTTAKRIQMTAMPQLVAAFHSLVGLAAVLVAAAAFFNPGAFGILGLDGNILVNSRIEMTLGAAIGAITFSGSVIAFAKLNGNMSGKPILLPMRHVINLGTLVAILVLAALFAVSPDAGPGENPMFWVLVALAFAIGFLLIIPIGGADMPVEVSMLNSYSGWAAAAMGFTLHNTAMIVTGALVGSSGAILSYIMCRAMNRSFISVIAGGFGAESSSGGAAKVDRPWKRGSAEDAAFMLQQAENVIIIPGYGMAVAQAQHALREMADLLKAEGVSVKYAIHPVAGRMPGHMNVLLAEASVPYDEVFELEDINSDFAQSDVAFVIGANDVTNPAAKDDPASPIFGMPVLEVWKANTVMFIKRGMSSGYAGVENELFFKDNTLMLFADAKKMVEDINKAMAH
ncbi:MAG TPA: NAD(P)(+) transhydrogenase (Re/Si-specific) subunit beta [Croceibacterium sp.]|nr:NAD(P)(+) transhydrogenase (Re/Si-specific) subunit beta [Croceibacterium sp.]